MITNIKFGECLKFLLSTLDISINRLSKAINVDSSLVNRWIHGKRIPSYGTPYIDGISEYLSNNVYNTFQRQSINELFLNVCEDNELTYNIKEKIKKLLLESQGYSIVSKKKEGKESNNFSANKEKTPKFIDKNQYDIISENTTLNTDNITHFSSLSKEDKIIFGSENVLAASISLLEAAAKKQCRDSNTIYVTYNNDRYLESYPNNSLINWRNALLKAINNGWNVVTLLKLNNNTDRTIEFINLAKPLIQTGKFVTYYIKKYDSFATGEEVIIIPKIGVLSCFSNNLSSEVCSAFYLKNKAAVDVLKNHFINFIRTCALPLVKNYSDENNIDYYHCLAETEENIGNRFLYKYSFSVLTLPEALYEKLLKRKKLSNDEYLIEFQLYKRRLKAFHSNIHNYEYKDIYLADSIKDLIKHNQYYFYNSTGVELIHLETEDIIQYLQNIINLLKTYDNYSIAFIPQNTDGTVRSDTFYCVVKERQAVLLETVKNVPEIRLSIEEPMLIKAFNDKFKEMWEHIAPVNKDKKEVIAWLQSEINILENRCKKK